ncbi:DUF2931 family protein [Enterobacter kobei]|uniref:DUF2931 family protein n=2 Tax=Enterobacter kobei TaxID=208224 RepID=A0AA86IQF5_9ENTR|nr:DUF2931 family protein [Enterobacter kobei]OLR21039.1 type VI secretion protein [Enterobacter kobei]BCU55624.1 hypothetical protein ENKO_22180 [Enterobacter kobei]
MNKLLNAALIMAGLVALSGCHDRRAAVMTPFGEGVNDWGKKLPYDHWQFNFFYPENLPAAVTMAFIEDGNVSETVYRQLDAARPSRNSKGSWSRTVGAFTANFNTGTALPVHMFICWDSVIDKKAYETEIWFGKETWMQMTTAYPDPYKPGIIYYRNNLIIGLAPGGTVRVWLENNGEKVMPQRSVRLITVSGDKMLRCKATRHRIDFNYNVPSGYDPFIRDFIKMKKYPYGNW